MSNEENTDKPKMNSLVKHIVLVVIFLGLGIFIGIYGTSKYLESKDSIDEENVDSWPLEITSKAEYNEQIETLYSMVKGNAKFYSTTGFDYSTLSDVDKLTYIYNSLVANSVGETTTIDSIYYGSSVCNYGFSTDPASTDISVSNICTLVKISKEEFTKAALSLFNDKVLNVEVEFSPADGKKCIVENDYYLCGNVNVDNAITGDLESKFEILKVTKDKDDTIKIYDKGYLVDKRSNVVNPNDGIDNYYLHSSDSTQYYYELKSADNLTFVHMFKKNENGKYYFVSSSLYKE